MSSLATMPPEPGSPFYVCPHDRSPLRLSPQFASCPACGSTYPIQDRILLLDAVRRPDREAFDQAASGIQCLAPEQRSAGRKKAEALLAVAEIDQLNAGAILDIGCGFGDLTYGLASNQRIRDSELYAIDHSIHSLRVLFNSVIPEQGNRVHLSTQDASALCFPDGSFDLVAGSAVLHHILDYGALLRSVYGTLKPGGKAVFMEPFLNGYLFAAVFLALAVKELGLSGAEMSAPEFGMCRWLIEDTAYRAQHENDLPALDHLADKHYFREDRLVRVGRSLGFRDVSFTNYEPPEFYDDFMRLMMFVYGITDPRLTAAAARYYDVLREVAGQTLPNVISHFKYVRFLK